MPQHDLTRALQDLSVLALPVLLAITSHEAAHGIVAYWLGDDTAYRLGRVSLNPLRHIDPFGTVVLPILLYLTGGFLFGFAKPVPTNAGRLRSPRRDMVLVALAGPGMNIGLALLSAALVYLAIWLPAMARPWAIDVLQTSVTINLVLAMFNILPLPPLDGSHVIASLLPRRLAIRYSSIGRYGILIVLALFFILPQLTVRLGMPLDPFAWLIGRPVEWMSGLVWRIVGLY
jgi:Zn-dependent protease